jgi:hypothetical protein
MGTYKRPYQRAQRSRIWKNYAEKYGFPSVSIVASGLTWKEACDLEVLHISIYGRKDKTAGGTLINLTDGGEGAGGRVITEAEKEKLRLIHTGRVHTEKTRRTMSASKLGKSLNNKEGIRQPVACYTKQGVRVAQYRDSYEPSKDGFNDCMVRRTAQCKSLFTKNHFFVYLSDEACPAFMSIRLHLANKKRKEFSQQAKENIREGIRRRDLNKQTC